jgi:hypothetical protein
VVVGPLDRHGGEDRQDRFGAVVDKPRPVPLTAGDVDPPIPPTVRIEELLQQPATHLVQGGPEGHLGGLQVHVAPVLALVQHAGH